MQGLLQCMMRQVRHTCVHSECSHGHLCLHIYTWKQLLWESLASLTQDHTKTQESIKHNELLIAVVNTVQYIPNQNNLYKFHVSQMQKYDYLIFLERKHVVQLALSLKTANINQMALYLYRSLNGHHKLSHLLTNRFSHRIISQRPHG